MCFKWFEIAFIARRMKNVKVLPCEDTIDIKVMAKSRERRIWVMTVRKHLKLLNISETIAYKHKNITSKDEKRC